MGTILDSINTSIKNWWWFIIKGILLIVAGIAIFYRPLQGYVGLSVLFSWIIIGSGLSQIFFSMANSQIMKGWGWALAAGIFDLAIGIYLLIYPVITMATLPYILGFWLLFGAFYLVGESFDLKSLGIRDWGWLLIGGILALFLAFMVLYYPAAGAISIITWSGSAFVVAGLLNLVLGFELKSIKATVKDLKKEFQHG